jgi:hypothetical protein
MNDDLDAQLKAIATDLRAAAAALKSIAANRLVTTVEGQGAQRRLDTLKDLIHEFARAARLPDDRCLDESILALDPLKAKCEALDPGEEPHDRTLSREETLDSIERTRFARLAEHRRRNAL